MLWKYDRNGLHTSYEVNQSADGSRFELTRRHEDGREEGVSFETLEELDRHIRDLQQELAEAGWSLAGALSVSGRAGSRI